MKPLKILLLVFFILSGCSKTPDILFCEGTTPEGEGVSCGSTFSSGDLTALYKKNENFGVNQIQLNIYEIKEGRSKKVESIPVEVKADSKSMSATLSLYNAGTYEVEVILAGNPVARQKLTIIDQE